MSNALKALVAALSAGLVVLHTVLLTGGAVTWADWQTIVDAAIGPVLVYLVPNLPVVTQAMPTATGSSNAPVATAGKPVTEVHATTL